MAMRATFELNHKRRGTLGAMAGLTPAGELGRVPFRVA
jgi:hypothetical protein